MAGVIWADGETGEILRVVRGGEPVDPAEPPAAGAVALAVDVERNIDLLAALIAAPGCYRLRDGELTCEGEPVTLLPPAPSPRAQAAAVLAELDLGGTTTVEALQAQVAALVGAVQLLLDDAP